MEIGDSYEQPLRPEQPLLPIETADLMARAYIGEIDSHIEPDAGLYTQEPFNQAIATVSSYTSYSGETVARTISYIGRRIVNIWHDDKLRSEFPEKLFDGDDLSLALNPEWSQALFKETMELFSPKKIGTALANIDIKQTPQVRDRKVQQISVASMATRVLLELKPYMLWQQYVGNQEETRDSLGNAKGATDQFRTDSYAQWLLRRITQMRNVRRLEDIETIEQATSPLTPEAIESGRHMRRTHFYDTLRKADLVR